MNKYNRSRTYLLPLLSELIDIEPKFIKDIVNTYMFVEPEEECTCLAILHNFSFKHPEFTAYEHRLTASNLFLKQYDINDKVLYIFKFPEEYITEYTALYDGRYSEFGPDAKELILNFWATIYNNKRKAIPVLQYVKQVLFKDEKLRLELEKDLNVTIERGSELCSKIDIEDETFKLN